MLPLAVTPSNADTPTHIENVKRILRSTMLRSKRRGTWYRLSRPERSIWSLALRLRVKFKSPDLMSALVSIAKKLEAFGRTLHSRFTRGITLAWAFSAAAVSWGHMEAIAWRNDLGYIEFLGLVDSGGARRG
jgi:hypothetical protein